MSPCPMLSRRVSSMRWKSWNKMATRERQLPGSSPANVLDGNADTAWQADATQTRETDTSLGSDGG